MSDTTNNFGTYHISSNLRDYEVARSNFFSFVVDDIDNLLRSDFSLTTPTDADYIKKGQEKIKLSVTKSSVPNFSLETIPIRRGNSVVKFAGNPSFDDGEIEVQDFVGLDIKSVLQAWRALAYDVINDKGGRAVNYKKNCTLIEYTQDYKEIRSWTLIGCWISKIVEDAFDMNANGDRKITVTIPYDRAYMHLPDTQ